MVDGPGAPGAVGSLLQKAGEYVVRYEQAFRNVVAEERYEQIQRRSRRPVAAAGASKRSPRVRRCVPVVAAVRAGRGAARLRSEVVFSDAAGRGALEPPARRARGGRPRAARNRPPGAALPRFAVGGPPRGERHHERERAPDPRARRSARSTCRRCPSPTCTRTTGTRSASSAGAGRRWAEQETVEIAFLEVVPADPQPGRRRPRRAHPRRVLGPRDATEPSCAAGPSSRSPTTAPRTRRREG